MALVEDCLYEYLQIAIQTYLAKNRNSDQDVQKTMESLGFKVGYQLIERHLFFLIFLIIYGPI